jgi:hypothetical protein
MTENIVVVGEYEKQGKAEVFHGRNLHKEAIVQEVL